MQLGRNTIPRHTPMSLSPTPCRSSIGLQRSCRCCSCRASARHRSISCTARSTSSLGNFESNGCPRSLDPSSTRGLQWRLERDSRRSRFCTKLQATNLQEEVLLPLGLDFLTFLAATVLVIPIFKSVKASPVLGFLFTGLVLGQLG